MCVFPVLLSLSFFFIFACLFSKMREKDILEMDGWKQAGSDPGDGWVGSRQVLVDEEGEAMT